MKIEVPFFRQTSEANCGPNALRMVLAYLGNSVGIEIIEEKSGIKQGKGVSTLQLAITATLLGYKAELFSKYIYFNEENMKLEFYKKYADVSSIHKKLVDEAKQLEIQMHEWSIPLNKLLSYVTINSLPLVLVDWNVVRGKKERGFRGHFVPVVGYDSEKVYVHNGGTETPTPFFPIPRKIFDEARKAKGTDEDILVIYRKLS